jgi:hypothetical protein
MHEIFALSYNSLSHGGFHLQMFTFYVCVIYNERRLSIVI